MMDLLKPLHILMVEDSEDDATLLLRELGRGGLEIISERVDSADALSAALERNVWDIILADYSIPGFSGMAALTLVQAKALDIPFIIVSGAIGEDIAVEAMRAGAVDFFLKGSTTRLVPAIVREVSDARERQQRRFTEAQLRQSEIRFARVFHANPIAITITSFARGGRGIDANERFLSLFEYNYDDVIGKTAEELNLYVNWEDGAFVRDTLFADQTLHDFETVLRTKSGRQLVTLVSCEKIEIGDEICILSMIHDITERKEAERVLREREERFRALLENGYDGIALLTTEGIVQYVSPSSHILTGWQDEELLGVNALKLVHPDDRPEVETEFLQLIESALGSNRVFSFRFRHKSGSYRWCEAIFTNLLAHPTIGAVVLNYRDMNERKLAENELRALYNATSVLFRADNVLGLGHQIVEVIVGEFGQVNCSLMLVDSVQNTIRGLAKAGDTSYALDYTLAVDGPGLIAIAARSGMPVYVPDVKNDPNYLVGNAQTQSELVIPLAASKGVIGVIDLQSPKLDAFSERDQRVLYTFAERVAAAIETMQLYEEINHYAGELEWSVAKRTAELHQAKEQVEAILNNTSDAIVLATTEGVIERINPAFSALFGFSDSALIKRDLQSLLDPISLDALNEAMKEVASQLTPRRIELVFYRADGMRFDADAAIAPVMQFDNAEFTVICSLRDITERKQAEENLLKALEKEKEVNELKTRFASMISHDFRNPLAVIQTASDMLKHYEDRMTRERKAEQLDEIQRQVRHMTNLMEDFLTINRAESKGIDVQWKPVNLATFLADLAREMQAMSKEHQIDFRCEGEFVTVLLDPNLLRRAVTNLLSNAIKYSPDSHQVWMTLREQVGQAVISVKDQGIGIPLEDREPLFDVFYRARNVGGIVGTGLGLAIVKLMTEALNGTIEFESELGQGTTFSLLLPMKPA
jgi:PAS domain S-box-containing protein